MVMWYENIEFRIDEVWQGPVNDLQAALQSLRNIGADPALSRAARQRAYPGAIADALYTWRHLLQVITQLNNECGTAPGSHPPDIRLLYRDMARLITESLLTFAPNEADDETHEEMLADLAHSTILTPDGRLKRPDQLMDEYAAQLEQEWSRFCEMLHAYPDVAVWLQRRYPGITMPSVEGTVAETEETR